jgi:hypothetical protein
MKKRTSTVLAILAVLLFVGTVAAVPYIVLQWTSTYTVKKNPKVAFYYWYTGAGGLNGTCNYSYTYNANVFPGLKTKDDNASEGLYCNDTVNHNVAFQVASTTAQLKDIVWFYYNITTNIHGSTAPLYSQNFSVKSPVYTWGSTVSVVAGTKYLIQIYVQCNSTATVGDAPSFTLNVQCYNP